MFMMMMMMMMTAYTEVLGQKKMERI